MAKKLLIKKTKVPLVKVQVGNGVPPASKYNDYATLCSQSLNTPPDPKRGFSYDDMKVRLKIDEAIDNLKEKGNEKWLVLDDDLAMILMEAVKSTRWWVRHDDLIAFSEDVANMQNE